MHPWNPAIASCGGGGEQVAPLDIGLAEHRRDVGGADGVHWLSVDKDALIQECYDFRYAEPFREIDHLGIQRADE